MYSLSIFIPIVYKICLASAPDTSLAQSDHLAGHGGVDIRSIHVLCGGEALF
jgi:hypothetical protein